jgi:hypothetical protein
MKAIHAGRMKMRGKGGTFVVTDSVSARTQEYDAAGALRSSRRNPKRKSGAGHDYAARVEN